MIVMFLEGAGYWSPSMRSGLSSVSLRTYVFSCGTLEGGGERRSVISGFPFPMLDLGI
jgi:hypothetical protein